MHYEVEQKYPIGDMRIVLERLIALGATIGELQIEVDLYFTHPTRDYSKTDEAFRIRRKGPKNYITYKGPKIDATTKTRLEIELPLHDGEESAQGWTSLLEALGFKPVGEVCKSRRKAQITWQGREIECCLDQVQGLGDFCELELQSDQAGLESAKTCIASLAEKLGLKLSERRSYLELLMEV
jgi:adenylate cyclase, class 2